MNKGSGMKPMLIDLKGSGINTTSPEEQDETLSINTNGISALRQRPSYSFSSPFLFPLFATPSDFKAWNGCGVRSVFSKTSETRACLHERSINHVYLCLCACTRASGFPTKFLVIFGRLALAGLFAFLFLLMVWEDLCKFFPPRRKGCGRFSSGERGTLGGWFVFGVRCSCCFCFVFLPFTSCRSLLVNYFRGFERMIIFFYALLSFLLLLSCGV